MESVGLDARERTRLVESLAALPGAKSTPSAEPMFLSLEETGGVPSCARRALLAGHRAAGEDRQLLVRLPVLEWSRTAEPLAHWRDPIASGRRRAMRAIEVDLLLAPCGLRPIGRLYDRDGRFPWLAVGSARPRRTRAAIGSLATAFDTPDRPRTLWWRALRRLSRLTDRSSFPDLRLERPEKFVRLKDLHGVERPLFHASSPADYDWLEERISTLGYYETNRPWTSDVSVDQRAMAYLLSLLRPQSALELGCSSGPLVACLADRGVDAHGLDVSQRALSAATETVRARLRRGDLLDTAFDRTFSMIVGLDVFEHLNPNKLASYLSRVHSLLEPGGLVFINAPVWGPDPIFGTVFPLERNDVTSSYAEWRGDFDADRLFQWIPVDDSGFPILGHLVWANSNWWCSLFERAGFVRLTEVERALHRKFDWFIQCNSVARRSFFLLARRGDSVDTDRLCTAVAA